MEDKGIYPVSPATLSRVFADGSEDTNFNYETTIRPIAEALLDIENIEDDDTLDVKAMKAILKYKIERIKELEETVKEQKTNIANEKIRYHEKLEKERNQFKDTISFLKDQISLKDRRYDTLLATISKKDELYNQLLGQILSCPARNCTKQEN